MVLLRSRAGARLQVHTGPRLLFRSPTVHVENDVEIDFDTVDARKAAQRQRVPHLFAWLIQPRLQSSGFAL